MTISAKVDGQFRIDGGYSPPGPDGNYNPYPIKNPSYFAPEAGKVREFTASMTWSNGDGQGPVHPAVKVVRCLVINGATLNFYTGANDPYADTTVRFEFYPAH